MADILKSVEPPTPPVKSARLRALEGDSARLTQATRVVKLLRDPSVHSVTIKAAGGQISKIRIDKGRGAAAEYFKGVHVKTSSSVGVKDRYVVVSAADLAIKQLSSAFADKLDYGDKELHWSFAEAGELKGKGSSETVEVKLHARVGDEDEIAKQQAERRNAEEREDDKPRRHRSRPAEKDEDDDTAFKRGLGSTAASAGAFENAKNAWGAGKFYMDPLAGADHSAFLPRFKEGNVPFDIVTVKTLERDYKYNPNTMDSLVSEYNQEATRLNEMTRKDQRALADYGKAAEMRQSILTKSREFAKAAVLVGKSGGKLAAALELARDRADVLDRRADSASAFAPRSLDRR